MRFILAALFGLVGGWACSGLICLIHYALKNELDHYYLLLGLFAFLWIVYGVFSVIGRYLLGQLTQSAIYDLRIELTRACM
ncbi:MAG: hypothetical protein HOD85_18035, partial [Deltaproteobacteria bacterium]|nr:hypothetical protein [Deltaproteobacteria bacterium]